MNTTIAVITAITITVGTFDRYIDANYSQLRSEAQRICWNDPDFEDILVNTLMRVRQRISDFGFTPTKYNSIDRSLFSYIWMSINTEYNQKKQKQSNKHLSYLKCLLIRSRNYLE